jgi:hypothetical protein
VTHSHITKLIVINYQIGRNKPYQESLKTNSQNRILKLYKIDNKQTTNLIFYKNFEYVNFSKIKTQFTTQIGQCKTLNILKKTLICLQKNDYKNDTSHFLKTIITMTMPFQNTSSQG